MLAGVHESTGGKDGFVSLEVEPSLAHDTEGIAEPGARPLEARRPAEPVGQDPGQSGVPAIEQAIAEGINVNVTLLFSVEAYTAIAEAYIRGMERRKEAGEALDVHSVASFFVSRVDTEVDQRLAELRPRGPAGIAAVANARAAYERFKELFRGERFAAVREAGALQRPLWASTGVKDPQYPETKYVDELVAPDTVNTMPMPTLLAAAECAEVKGNTADQDPVDDLTALHGAGIDMKDVTDKLLRDGIAKFVEPFDKLVAGSRPRARASSRAGRPPSARSWTTPSRSSSTS